MSVLHCGGGMAIAPVALCSLAGESDDVIVGQLKHRIACELLAVRCVKDANLATCCGSKCRPFYTLSARVHNRGVGPESLGRLEQSQSNHGAQSVWYGNSFANHRPSVRGSLTSGVWGHCVLHTPEIGLIRC